MKEKIGQLKTAVCKLSVLEVLKAGYESLITAKGQLISKCLFCVFNFLQKTNENKSHSSKSEFIRLFFGGNVGLKISFSFCLTFTKVGDSLPFAFLTNVQPEIQKKDLSLPSVQLCYISSSVEKNI